MRAGNKRDQLAEVLGAFEVEVSERDLLTRCARCNGEFIPRYCRSAKLPSCTVHTVSASPASVGATARIYVLVSPFKCYNLSIPL